MVLDYLFEDGVGEEFLSVLGERRGAAGTPSVLILSGFADCLDRDQFRDFAFVKGVLAKPVERERLLSAALKAMRERLSAR